MWAIGGIYAKGEEMRLEIKRKSIEVVPENDQDIAFIEDVLGLDKDGKKTEAKRVDPDGFGGTVTIKIKQEEKK